MSEIRDLCNYFHGEKGYCTNGDECQYIHSDEYEVNILGDHINLKIAKLCYHLIEKGVCNGGNNNFPCVCHHNNNNVIKKGKYYWDTMFSCHNLKDKKICEFGKKCMHYHENAKLIDNKWILESDLKKMKSEDDKMKSKDDKVNSGDDKIISKIKKENIKLKTENDVLKKKIDSLEKENENISYQKSNFNNIIDQLRNEKFHYHIDNQRLIGMLNLLSDKIKIYESSIDEYQKREKSVENQKNNSVVETQ